MSTHQRYMQYRKDELYHYNHNHDPKDGRFTSGPGGRLAAVAASRDPEYDKRRFGLYIHDIDDEIAEENDNVVFDKVLPKLNGIDKDDYELRSLTSMELSDHFYTEYKNYVHDHPEDKSRLDDYVEYVIQNANQVDKNFTPIGESGEVEDERYSSRHPTDQRFTFPPQDKERASETPKHKNVDFGNNKSCPIVLQNGFTDKQANEVLSDRSLDNKFREYAANRSYSYVNKDSLIAQQITFLGRMEDTGMSEKDDSKADIIAWYGETPDGAGEMMYYNTKQKKIVASEFYS